MKIFFVIFLSTFLTTTAFALDSQNTNAKIQAVLDQARIQYGAPAMQVSVSLPGEYAPRNFVSGTKKLNGKTNITTDGLFQIGSNTKAFITVLILQLEAHGKLSIDDPIDKYINFSKHPAWPSEWKNVTIKQLLNMTSGIFNYTDDQNFMNDVTNNPNLHFTATQLIDISSKHPDYFKPGMGWQYSNTDYVLAGKIIKNITGKTVAQMMTDKLLGSTQYNLDNTYYAGSHDYSKNINARTVNTYLFSDGKIKNVSSQGLTWANSAGCMLSTGSDMVRWVRALYSGLVLQQQQLDEIKSLVCSSVFPELGCTLGQPVRNNGFGLGIMEEYDPQNGIGKIWIYGGQTLGTTSTYVWIPSYNTVIYVVGDYTNPNGQDYVHNLLNKIFKILLQSHSWKHYRQTHEMLTDSASQFQGVQFPSIDKL